MVLAYHNSVQKALLAYGKNLIAQKRAKKVYEGNRRPLSIVDSRSKYVVNYQPDVYYILRNNKKLIFEILDSEEEKQDIIIADIIRSILVENVEAIILIHRGKSTVETRILSALKTIYKGLTDKGVSLTELPNLRKTAPYVITEIEAKSQEVILKRLTEYQI